MRSNAAVTDGLAGGVLAGRIGGARAWLASRDGVPGWRQPRVVMLAMLALGMALFVAIAVSREQAEPELLRVADITQPAPTQPLPQPVVPAPLSVPAAAAPAAPVSAPGMTPAVSRQLPGQLPADTSTAASEAAPVIAAPEQVVVSPADGVYIGASPSEVAGPATSDAGPVVQSSVALAEMSESELRDWRRQNAESMKVLEASTPEVAGFQGETPVSVQPAVQ